jgi:hypothetical protein
MKPITRPAVAVLLLLIALIVTINAQQKRQTPNAKPQPKPAVATTPAPTFDTLIPSDTYVIYGEVRGAGQVIRSTAVNDLLEPVLKLSRPPKEFRTIVKWLNAHAEEVMTSRLLLATWPNHTAKDLPEAMIAIEFASADEATKFASSLKEFLPTVLPPPAPAPSPEPSAEKALRSDAVEKPKPASPNFHLKRFGSLVVITPKPWTIKQLKPAGSKLLAEDANFRAAHNRFNSEPLFVYLDTRAIQRQDDENRKRWELERIEALKRAEEEQATTKEKEPAESENTPADNFTVTEQIVGVQATVASDLKDAPTPDQITNALAGLTYLFFSGEADLPDGVGFALSFEGDSFDLRALLVNQTGEKADALPFVPMLMTGPAFAPEAPNIFPADTELLATMSLDLPQIYATISKQHLKPEFIAVQNRGDSDEIQSPLTELEKRLKLSLKDDLLPLLGPEVALRLPMQGMNAIGLVGIRPMILSGQGEQKSTNGPAVAIALRDKEAVRALMPKIIENLGFKGANAFAQTERRENTEIVSYANLFSYAFIGNFIVLSGDPATTRHIVDSYLKNETLAGEIQFRNSTRWQPKPQHGQLYISPALMEGYKSWAEQPATRVSEQTRAFLMRASSVAQPITYSLSNEGLGPLHEVHIPKSLVVMAVAGISGETNAPPTIQNERVAIGVMYTIVYAQQEYKKSKGNGSCGTLEQLIAAELLSKEMVESSGYTFVVTVSGDKFEVSAVPSEYGKSGKLSLFIDQTGMLRGGDRNGGAANASDPQIN